VAWNRKYSVISYVQAGSKGVCGVPHEPDGPAIR
jgi:hypothetical protein